MYLSSESVSPRQIQRGKAKLNIQALFIFTYIQIQIDRQVGMQVDRQIGKYIFPNLPLKIQQRSHQVWVHFSNKSLQNLHRKWKFVPTSELCDNLSVSFVQSLPYCLYIISQYSTCHTAGTEMLIPQFETLFPHKKKNISLKRFIICTWHPARALNPL